MRYSVQLVLVNGAELIKSSALSRFKIEKWERNRGRNLLVSSLKE